MKFLPIQFSRGAKVFLFLALFLILFRAALPIVGKYYINYVLQNNLENYTGSIQDFDLVLLRGLYRLEGLRLYKKEVKQKPFIAFERADIGIDWENLFQGRVVANIDLFRVTVLMIDAEKQKERQFGNEEKVATWKKTLDDIVPISIEKVKIAESKFLFDLKDVRGFEANSISEIHGVVHSLVTAEKMKDQLSPLQIQGKLNNHAPLAIKGGINIEKNPFVFDIHLHVEKFKVTSTNELLRHYIPVDLTKGVLDVNTNLKGSLQQATGQLTIKTKKLDVISKNQDYLGVKHFFIEIVAGFVNWIVGIVDKENFKVEMPMVIENGAFKFKTKEASFDTIENM